MRTSHLLFVAMIAASAGAACSTTRHKRPDLAPPMVPRGAVRPPTYLTSAETEAPRPPPPQPLPSFDPPPQGQFRSIAWAEASGKIDKVGSKDAAFKPDGARDLVLRAEMEGPAVAFILVSTDASGTPNGAFSADTFIGTQLPPSEPGVEIKPGAMTAGLVVFEGDKLLNQKDGTLTPLSSGSHELTLYVSARNVPKGSFKLYAVFDDRSFVASPTLER